MFISRIYIQDNFVPNYSEDQFRRKVIGIEVSMNESDNLDEAISKAEQEIHNYISTNTVQPKNHIEVKDIEQEPVNPVDSFIEAINTSTTKKGVEIFRKLVEKQNIPQLTEAFNNKLKTFE